MKHRMTRIKTFFLQKPTGWDVALTALGVAFITFQPFFLHHEIIMMETGIHLPAINALFHGLVPYRDFFFLRGPLELYVPAAMMALGGFNSALLPVFYYAGTMATLFFCVMLAGELFRSRLIFYAMMLAFVARTFPRISYYYWGGMRYALGFLVILCLFYFLKTQRRRWMFLTGLACALSALTTPEAGMSTIFAVGTALVFAWAFKIYTLRFTLRSFWIFCAGLLSVILPYSVYLICTGSLHALLESTYVVAALSNAEFPGAPGIKPETVGQFLSAMVPDSHFFKYMTVAWCYAFFAVFLYVQSRRKAINWVHAFLTGLAAYGLILYAAAFRKIEGHHFEMALQAEKFIYFFMIESAFLYAWARWSTASIPWRRALPYAIAAGILLSSAGFAVQRFAHRFTMYKYIQKTVFHARKMKGMTFLDGQDTVALNIERASGNIVPRWQEEEIRGVVDFLKTHTQPDEPVFCFPEVGSFNFWADRPFVGKFPITTFSWFYQPWYEELWADLQKASPRYVVMTHLGHRTFPESWYFRNPRNRVRFERMSRFILEHYKPVKSFESVAIYERKSSADGSTGDIKR
jgi:hypothetical protein